MVNQQLIDSYHLAQRYYTSARRFAPGEHQLEYRLTERGRPRPMDLLVVIHNDVPPTDVGLHRVDLIVNSGDTRDQAEHANGHLVNTYDPEAGVTDHTALYTDTDLARIHEVAGPPAVVLATNLSGLPVLDIDAPPDPRLRSGPVQPSRRAGGDESCRAAPARGRAVGDS